MWRVGGKVPLNVYEDDRPVCQCHSAEDAKRIVKAMNRLASASQDDKPKAPLMDFADALKVLKRGGVVTRVGWHVDGMTLRIAHPVAPKDLPYIYVTTAEGTRVPWSPASFDILAEDWTEVA